MSPIKVTTHWCATPTRPVLGGWVNSGTDLACSKRRRNILNWKSCLTSLCSRGTAPTCRFEMSKIKS